MKVRLRGGLNTVDASGILVDDLREYLPGMVDIGAMRAGLDKIAR